MTDHNLDLAKLLVDRSYVHGDFVLASGRRSSFYFDCKLTTCFSEAMPRIGRAFIEEFRRCGELPRSVGGLTSGADPIAHAIARESLEDERRIDMFLVRKEQKTHGTMKWIEGCVDDPDPIAIVDDVITSGQSVLQAIERCREENFKISHVAVLVDRQEGGLEAIQSEVGNIPVTALFRKSELDAIQATEQGDA